jgi:hypothetical protein
MKIGDYDFRVGDEVVTTRGIRGTITEILDNPDIPSHNHYIEWRDEFNDLNYIMCSYGEPDIYRIGKHRFNPLDPRPLLAEITVAEKHLESLNTRLKFVEGLLKEESE